MVTFCILTCTFNAVKVLGRTLDSVGQQSYQHVRHIIVDGLSTDGTVAMAEAYAAKYNNGQGHHSVKMVSEKDHGLYDAMNKALSLAEGDYIVFLNAGDTLADDTTLERMAQILEKKGGAEMPAVLYGDTDIVDAKGDFLRKRRLHPPVSLSWKSFADGMLVCHQSFYVRTDIARHVEYNLRYKLSADVDWCIRVMKQAEDKGLELLNTHLTLCRYLEGGMSVKNHRASLIERFNIMARHYGLVRTIYKHFTFFFR